MAFIPAGVTAPEQQGDGLVKALQHGVQDELVLILSPGHEEHEVPEELVHHDDVIEHGNLRCNPAQCQSAKGWNLLDACP